MHYLATATSTRKPKLKLAQLNHDASPARGQILTT